MPGADEHLSDFVFHLCKAESIVFDLFIVQVEKLCDSAKLPIHGVNTGAVEHDFGLRIPEKNDHGEEDRQKDDEEGKKM